MRTGMSLTELATQLEERRDNRKDYIADTRQLTMLPHRNQIEINPDTHEVFSVDETAHRQIAARLGIPFKYYTHMQDNSQELLATNVNHWFHEKPENRMIRTLNGAIDAFLSNKYQRVDNHEIAEIVLPILLNTPGVKIESCMITKTRMYIKAIFTGTEAEVGLGDVVQAGVAISNSEIGLGSVKIEPLILRLVCLNGMILNDSKLNIRHVGARADNTEAVYEMLSDETLAADDKAILLKVRDIVNASFDDVRFNMNVQKMRESTENKIEGNPVKAVEVLAKKASMTEHEKGSVLRNLIEGADLSQYGLLNAVTRTSQEIENYDRATEFEVMGGQILNLPKSEWKVLAEAA